jgi:gluconolactonase
MILRGFTTSYRALPLNGVFSFETLSKLLSDGIGLSPDERTLYVANSDPQRPIWMAYELDAKGDVVSKRVFADASDLMQDKLPGLPDGLTVAADGTLFASAPGGILIMTPQAKRLGRINTGTAASNCDFGDDGRTLYITSNNFIARTRLAMNGWGK